MKEENNWFTNSSVIRRRRHIKRGNEHAGSNQANGPISTDQLNAFRYTRLHFLPINLLVLKGTHGEN
jgi:hypothetical protein